MAELGQKVDGSAIPAFNLKGLKGVERKRGNKTEMVEALLVVSVVCHDKSLKATGTGKRKEPTDLQMMSRNSHGTHSSTPPAQCPPNNLRRANKRQDKNGAREWEKEN